MKAPARRGRRHNLVGRLFVLLAAASALVACENAPICGDFPLTPQVRACMLDEIEERVDRYYPFEADKEDVDLEEFRERLRSLGDEESDSEFLAGLQRTVVTLRDGHTRLTVQAPLPQGSPLVATINLPDGIYITASTEENVLPGDQLIEIDGRGVDQVFGELLAVTHASTMEGRRRIAARRILVGPRNRTVTVIVARGITQHRVVLRRFSPISVIGPPLQRRFGDIGYISLSTFALLDDVETFDRHLNELLDTTGLILDLRGNGGGHLHNADLILGRLMGIEPERFAMLDETGQTRFRFGPSPRGSRYKAPIVVLCDHQTYSAANYFVQRAGLHGVATIMGERTGGGAAPTRAVTLAPGVHFNYAFRVIVDPEGEHTEEGVAPDISINLSPADLVAGRAARRGRVEGDEFVARAVQFLEGR